MTKKRFSKRAGSLGGRNERRLTSRCATLACLLPRRSPAASPVRPSMGRVCELQVSGAGQVIIWVNSRDHCGPHAHCRDQARTWEGRIYFSFISNNVVSFDCLSKKDPGQAVFAEILKQIPGRLSPLRREWWRCNSNGTGCCLANTMQDDATGRPRRVATALYDPATNTTELTFTNNFVRMVQL